MVRSLSEYSAGMRWVGKNLTQTCALGLAIYAGSLTQTQADESSRAVMQQHETKLSENRVLAQELLLEGDVSYKQGDYKSATQSYKEACALIPNVPATAKLHASATERLAQSTVAYSTQLSRLGHYGEAKALLNAVLDKAVAPNHKGAKVALAKLDDPIRTNPALTPQIARDAEAAGKMLRKAEGHFNLGKFDDAHAAYKEVLVIDPYNRAARRGMERVNASISNYSSSAHDHMRSQALMDVDAAWETANDPQIIDRVSDESFTLDRIQEVRGNQLRQTLIPVVDFQDVDLTEAYETIRLWSRKYDKSAVSDADKGLNFVVNLGSATEEDAQIIKNKRITLSLKNVPLSEVLDYVSEATGTQWKVGDFAVVITPYGSADQTVRRRTFNVPPTFMLDAKASASSNDDDPFASDSGQGSALRGRVSAKEFLTTLGVTFPEGTSAKYISSAGSLIVTNTGQNLEIVESYVNSYTRGESSQVVMKVTIIETTQRNLEDIGFDWLVQAGPQGTNLQIGGGSRGSGDFIPTVSLPQNAAPVTSGLRSGNSLFSSNRLDGAINGTLGQSSRSPGILALSTNDFQVIMRGLSQKGNTSRLDTATLIARSGEKATLFNGREFIYPTEYEPPELPNSVGGSNGGSFPVTPATPTAFETRLVGMSLEAEATVSEDKNYIDLQIIPQRVDFEGFVNFGSPITSSVPDPLTGLPVEVVITPNDILQPVFKKIDLRGGNITVQNGSSFVIAGLTESSIETVEDKIPIVGDVPLVGRLFRSEGKSKVDRVLLIMVNVEALDPTGKKLLNQ